MKEKNHSKLSIPPYTTYGGITNVTRHCGSITKQIGLQQLFELLDTTALSQMCKQHVPQVWRLQMQNTDHQNCCVSIYKDTPQMDTGKQRQQY